jgi:hypothetical protein
VDRAIGKYPAETLKKPYGVGHLKYSGAVFDRALSADERINCPS